MKNRDVRENDTLDKSKLSLILHSIYRNGDKLYFNCIPKIVDNYYPASISKKSFAQSILKSLTFSRMQILFCWSIAKSIQRSIYTSANSCVFFCVGQNFAGKTPIKIIVRQPFITLFYICSTNIQFNWWHCFLFKKRHVLRATVSASALTEERDYMILEACLCRMHAILYIYYCILKYSICYNIIVCKK